MRLRFIGILAVLAMMLAVAAPVAADAPNDCPDPAPTDFADADTAAGETGTFVIDGTTVYYAVSADGKMISFFSDAARTLPLVVEFCVKGGSLANSGVLSLSVYTVVFLNDGGENPAISNFVVYSVPAPGTLTIVKQTSPDSAAGTFTFSATLNTVAQPAFTLSDGQSKVFTGNGTYVINETGMPSGSAGTWALTDISCGSAVVTETATGVTVTVTANAGISCTFTNTFTAALSGGGGGGGGSTVVTTPVRQGTLAGSLPNTAMDGSPVDQLPVMVLALFALGSLGYVAQRNIAAMNSRR